MSQFRSLAPTERAIMARLISLVCWVDLAASLRNLAEPFIAPALTAGISMKTIITRARTFFITLHP